MSHQRAPQVRRRAEPVSAYGRASPTNGSLAGPSRRWPVNLARWTARIGQGDESDEPPRKTQVPG